MRSHQGLVVGVALIIVGAIAWIVGEVAASDPDVIGANIGAGILILAGRGAVILGLVVVAISLVLRPRRDRR